MSSLLPINIEDLLHCRTVESARVEFKKGWNTGPTGQQVLRTICAFANDFHGLNGGYIILGVAEEDGRAVWPPAGLNASEIDKAQRWIRGRCNQLDPRGYQPIISPEVIEDRHVLVVWAPPGKERPFSLPDEATKSRKYWVRLGSETVDADASGMLRQLVELTAREPWDDRSARENRTEDLREGMVREHLRKVDSKLLDEPNVTKIYRRMQLTTRANGHEVPRNVALLFFTEEPTEWIRGAWIEVVQFPDDQIGRSMEERAFRGAIPAQIENCMHYLEGLVEVQRKKEQGRIEANVWTSYPVDAVREALVNAVLHRSYEADMVEPTKVYIYPDKMKITSYPGPVAGIERHHFAPGAEMPVVHPRNRRIGDFLRELGFAEGRLTGLPIIYRAMAANGSPEPIFEFDEGRNYFTVTLPVHPQYLTVSALRDAAGMRALGERDDALHRLHSAWEVNQASEVLAEELIRLHGESHELAEARRVFEEFEQHGPSPAIAHVAAVLVKVLRGEGQDEEAQHLLLWIREKYPSSAP